MQSIAADWPRRARAAARALAARLDLEDRLAPFAGQRWLTGGLDRAAAHLDDFSGIPFLDEITGVEDYQHRARLRARSGDLFAAVTPPTAGYESYCRTRLALAPVEFVHAEPVAGLLDLARACGAGRAWDAIVAAARRAGGLDLHPFMGIEEIWELAGRLAAAAAVPVRVIAPPPPVTWVANDKALLGELVEGALGAEWLVESRRAATPAALAGHLLELAARHEEVGLKRLRCASAMGNAVFDAARLLRTPPAAIEEEVRTFLERTEWDGVEEVQAVVWERTDISPSTQLWIPPLGSGRPRLDGIYEQILAGRERVFVGSRPSALPAAVDRRLGRASLAAASALQELGYVGRCSFDFLLVGEPAGDFRLRFTECNGRWGGTSTPMALLDRLLAGPRPPYRAQDFIRPGLVGAAFGDLLGRVGEELWDAASGRGRFIFYNTGPLAVHGKIDVIALAPSREEADAAVEEDLPRLLGL